MIDQRRVPPHAVLLVDARREVVPEGFFVRTRHAEAPIAPLVAGIAQSIVLGMVNDREAVAAEVARPTAEVFVIAGRGAVVLGAARIHARVVRVPRGTVKLRYRNILDVRPSRAVVLGFVQAAVGRQNARL